MEIFGIKRGDILVAEYPDVSTKIQGRNYITFIASGTISNNRANSTYISATIGVIGGIDLEGNFFVNKYKKRHWGIGFTIWSKAVNETSILRKPTFSEMTELINRLKENGYKYNKKTRNIEKL